MTNANDLIPPFWGFSAFTPTIPKLYWNVKSQEQRILNLFDLLDKLVCYCDNMGTQINVTKADIEALKEEFEKFKESGFLDYYEKQLTEWVEKNMPDLIAQAVKQVYFGLTDDGYFCAYIPDSWSDITFDTGAVFGRSDYGRLILKMHVDGEGVINNTYSYSLNAQPSTIKQLIADLENTTKRSDSTFDTLFTNIDQTISKGGDNI